MGASKERCTFAPSDATGAKAGGVGKGKPLAVVCIECFYFQSGAVVLRKQCNSAIRHRSIDVHQQYFDPPRALDECGRDFWESAQEDLRQHNESLR